MQRIITQPDSIADFLVDLVERVEALDWQVDSLKANRPHRVDIASVVDGHLVFHATRP